MLLLMASMKIQAYRIYHIPNINLLFPDRQLKTLAIVAGVISLLFGGLGLPRFVYGYIGIGVLQLLTIPLGGLGLILLFMGAFSGTVGLVIPGLLLIIIALGLYVWQVVDFILICTNS